MTLIKLTLMYDTKVVVTLIEFFELKKLCNMIFNNKFLGVRMCELEKKQ